MLRGINAVQKQFPWIPNDPNVDMTNDTQLNNLKACLQHTMSLVSLVTILRLSLSMWYCLILAVPLMVTSGCVFNGCMRNDEESDEEEDLFNWLASEYDSRWLSASAPLKSVDKFTLLDEAVVFECFELAVFSWGMVGDLSPVDTLLLTVKLVWPIDSTLFGLKLQFLIDELEVDTQMLSWFWPKSIFILFCVNFEFLHFKIQKFF